MSDADGNAKTEDGKSAVDLVKARRSVSDSGKSRQRRIISHLVEHGAEE